MKLTLLELIIKGIPEAIIFTLGMYAFSKTKIRKETWKKFGAFALLMFVWTYLVRLLPINYGVNMMLVLIFTIFLGAMFLKIPLFQCVKASLLNAVAIVLGEGINFLLLQVVYGTQRTQEIIGDPFLKAINTIPSTIVFCIIIVIVYYFNVLRVREKENADSDEENIS